VRVVAVGAILLGGAALAQGSTQIMTSAPAQSVTVNDWYKQSVYDPSNNKIGEIKDVLLSPDGKVNALIVGVAGFLGMGEKDVAVPFTAVKHTTKDGKVYLTLDTTKDALKAAPGLQYDQSSTTWVPEKDVNRARLRNPTVVGAIDRPHFSVGGSRAVLAKASLRDGRSSVTCRPPAPMCHHRGFPPGIAA
jgi:sporulation protein YlmC with PRC-barrel domain